MKTTLPKRNELFPAMGAQFTKGIKFLFFSMLTAFCMLISWSLTAQETQVIKISGDKDKFAEEVSNVQELDVDIASNLIFNLQPTAYIENGSILKITGGNRPVTKMIVNDIHSLGILNQKNEKLQKTELLVLKLSNYSDLAQPIDLSELENINRLKCIFLQCSFDCQQEDLQSFLLEALPGIKVFYSVSTPL